MNETTNAAVNGRGEDILREEGIDVPPKKEPSLDPRMSPGIAMVFMMVEQKAEKNITWFMDRGVPIEAFKGFKENIAALKEAVVVTSNNRLGMELTRILTILVTLYAVTPDRLEEFKSIAQHFLAAEHG